MLFVFFLPQNQTIHSRLYFFVIVSRILKTFLLKGQVKTEKWMEGEEKSAVIDITFTRQRIFCRCSLQVFCRCSTTTTQQQVKFIALFLLFLSFLSVFALKLANEQQPQKGVHSFIFLPVCILIHCKLHPLEPLPPLAKSALCTLTTKK